MNIKSCILVVLLAVLTVNAAGPGQKGSPCLAWPGFRFWYPNGTTGTFCSELACVVSVPMSSGCCDGGLNCCYVQPTPVPPAKAPPANPPPPNPPPPNPSPPNSSPSNPPPPTSNPPPSTSNPPPPNPPPPTSNPPPPTSNPPAK